MNKHPKMNLGSGQLKTEIKRINGYLKEVITFFDASGEPITHIINPLMTELKMRDALQIFVGALVVASPLCFTEEVWKISEELNILNVILMGALSICSISMYIYFNYYRFKINGNVINFVKRIFATYIITASSIVMLLILIDKFPFNSDLVLAVKRLVIIAFPAIFGATISDSLK
jgi:uncharacterized membrane protein